MLKKYEISYQKSFLALAIGLVALVFTFGFFLNLTRPERKLKELRLTRSFYQSRFQGRDWVLGKVVEVGENEVTIETMVILHNVFNFIKIWDKNISHDIIYPKVSRKIRKYGAFLNVNVDKYKKLTKETLLGDENTI